MSEEQFSSEWSGDDYSAQADHHRVFDDWFLDRLRPEADDVVIDLGCGSGEFTARLAEMAASGRAIGVEPDPSMLATAKRHVAGNLEFRSGSAEHLDRVVDESSADIVISRAMLHWLPLVSYPSVFRAVHTVLRPGGWFHSESAGAGNVPRVVELLEDLAERFDLPPPPPFPEAGTVFEMLEEAGFELPDDAVKTVAQRREFSRDELIGFIRSQATVALTREADDATGEAVVEAAVASAERLRRHDETYDQTFVRLELLARKPE